MFFTEIVLVLWFLVVMKLVSVCEEVCSACEGKKVPYRMALEGTRPD